MKTKTVPKQVNRYAPYASSYEVEYAKRLQLLKLAGEIKDWEHEPKRKFVIGFDCRYTPDFWVYQNDGTVDCVEVKGYFRDDAKVKLMVTASLFPYYRFVLVTKEQGNWVHKTIKTVKPSETRKEG